MRTTTSISRLCLYLYVCLSGIQLLLAHEANGQAMSAAKDGAVTMDQGDNQSTAQGKGQATDQSMVQSHKQATSTPSMQGGDDDKAKDQGMQHGSKEVTDQAQDQVMKQEKKEGQAMAQAQHQDKIGSQDQMKEQDMTDTKGQGQIQGKNNAQSQFRSVCDPQTQSNSQNQSHQGSNQQMAKSNDQAMSQGNDGQNNAQNNVQIIGGSQTSQATGSQSINQIVGEVESEVQNLGVGSSSQAQALAAAPPPNNAVMPVAPPPNSAVVLPAGPSAVGNTQQLTGGQARNQSTNAQVAKNAGASSASASNSARFSGLPAATTGTVRAGVAAGVSPAMPAGTGSSNAGTCNNCQCNCPMGSFPVAQQAAPPQSTLQTTTSTGAIQAKASTAAQQNLAASLGSVLGPKSSSTPTSKPPPKASVAQAQANQSPNVASPQSQGVTAGGAAGALPTNLSTFAFKSIVTVPLGRRRVARATAALR